MTDDSSSDSFSSDSDDEFLTMRGDGKGVDREALVRKKLLESFYGKTSGGDDDDLGKNDDSDSSSDDSSSNSDSFDGATTDDDDEEGSFSRRARRRRRRTSRVLPVSGGNGDADDLDSVHFDAPKHTERYVLKSSVRPLLETEESLACQVRTLDSSMQTLVYENYSRFIEATDAVRNIGVNVQCNAGNLKKLSSSVVEAGETAREVETSCGKLRDQVVEKLRTKRLLQRLETLLKLPSTLRESIGDGRYRWATKSYLKAYAILNKQSDGFESLQRIEQECHEIIELLLEDSKTKLLHWSGNLSELAEEEKDASSFDNQDEEDESKTNEELLVAKSSSASEDPPDPPENVAGIFECAGTPVLILNHQQQQQASTGQVGLQTSLTSENCQEMSLDACLRLIERFLDTHSIELQEAMLEDMDLGDATNDMAANDGKRLVPNNVLDSILEAAALYSVTFPSEESQERLSQFVSTAFSAFLQHVRRALLDQSTQTAYPKDLQRSISSSDVGGSGTLAARDESMREDAKDMAGDDHDEGQEDSEDQAYEHIANATALLLESVQQFSSGLALPEVAIDEALASSLVEQTVQISQAMVRRRVDQKFYILRFRVLQNCLAPFCRQALEASKKEETTQERIDRLVQTASVALSDSSQLVDDTVRSILSSDTTSNNATLKAAVEQSTARFAGWLAVAMEVMAGCESSEPNHVLDVMPEAPEDGETEAPSNIISPALFRHFADVGDNDLAELVENCMSDLLEELDELGATQEASVKSCLTLAIAEMCQVAERTVVDDINQSIATHTGSINKHRSAAGLFASTEGGGSSTRASKKDPTSMRFRLAASRVLSLYAMNRGDEAGESLCSNLLELSKEEEEEVAGPRVGAWSVLSVIKATAFDCAALFGSPKRAGPVPEVLDDEYASLTAVRQKQAFRSALAFDVERMFTEKVVAYPHPFENVDFDRNLVVVQVLKVAFKALREDVRLVRFSNPGYRQLLVDVEFLKFMLPHYVKDETLSDATNPLTGLESLLTEAINNAKERCDASAMLQDDTIEINQARAVVRDFMASNGGEDGLLQR
eukprot:CAMPEP_0116132144 /NCGR_PEP_ID=MMETSP0329-20121206/9391_1 /TAXON_ID=697910 /ORGANISM="Pseudo-nitzschia arenysensis, Strain B593" /LENGTH=1063 /DNA_ID=CAMNT_0003626639 /DNA_START=34 /DNA_END=3221 /DNA_ORIENTATION=-